MYYHKHIRYAGFPNSYKCLEFLSPGPALFLSERVGFRGRRFICFKFRTMKVNADTGVHKRHLEDLMRLDAPMVKMDTKGDSRLIPFGSALRATGLDDRAR